MIISLTQTKYLLYFKVIKKCLLCVPDVVNNEIKIHKYKKNVFLNVIVYKLLIIMGVVMNAPNRRIHFRMKLLKFI